MRSLIPSRFKHISERTSWEKFLLGLRFSTLLLSVIGTGAFTWAFTQQDKFYTDGDGAVFDIMPLGALGFSFCWSLLALGKELFQTPFHPGVNVGVDLVAWASLVSIGIMTTVAGQGLYGYSGTSCDDDLGDHGCDDLGRRLSAVERMGLAVTLLDGAVDVMRKERKRRSKDQTYVELAERHVPKV